MLKDTQIRLADALASVSASKEIIAQLAAAGNTRSLSAASTAAQAASVAAAANAAAVHAATPGTQADTDAAAAAAAALAAAVAAAAALAAAPAPKALSATTHKRVIAAFANEKFAKEIEAAILSGAALSKEAKRRCLIALSGAIAGNDLINSIQLVATKAIKL